MSEEIRKLIELTELDGSIHALGEQLALYPGMLEALESKGRVARERLQKAKDENHAAMERRRKLEVDVREMRDKIKHFRMQESQVKTNKEAEAIQSEVAGVEEKIDEADTRALEALEVEPSYEQATRGLRQIRKPKQQ